MSTVTFCIIICALIAVSRAYPRLKRQAIPPANITGRPCPARWSALLAGPSMAVHAFDPSTETIFTCACRPSFQCLSGMNGGGSLGMIAEEITGSANSFEVFPLPGSTCPPGNTCCCSDMQETAIEYAGTSDTAAMIAKLFSMRAMGGMNSFGGRPGSQSLMNNPMFWSTL